MCVCVLWCTKHIHINIYKGSSLVYKACTYLFIYFGGGGGGGGGEFALLGTVGQTRPSGSVLKPQSSF